MMQQNQSLTKDDYSVLCVIRQRKTGHLACLEVIERKTVLLGKTVPFTFLTIKKTSTVHSKTNPPTMACGQIERHIN